MATIRSINITPDQLVSPNIVVNVETDIPIKSDSIHGSIRLGNANGKVRLENNNKLLIWSSSIPIPEGKQTFEFGEVIAENGSMFNRMEIPVYVLKSNVRLPKDVEILHFLRVIFTDSSSRRLSLGQNYTGNYFEIFKVFFKTDKSVREVMYDNNGNLVNKSASLKERYNKYQERYGKLDELLYKKLKNIDHNKSMVAIWLNMDKRRPKRTEIYSTEMIEEYDRHRQEIRDKLTEYVERLRFQSNIEVLKISQSCPVVYANLSADEIKTIEKEKTVAKIFLVEGEFRNSIANSISLAKTNFIHSTGNKGRDIRVGVAELKTPHSDLLMDIEETYANPEIYGKNAHSWLVTGIIKNTGQIRGHAPGCTVYMANPATPSVLHTADAIEWALLDKGCSVINQSWSADSWGNPNQEPIYEYIHAFNDFISTSFPFPTIITVAGNDGIEFEDTGLPGWVKHRSYNTIKIGNLDDSLTIHPSSSWKNPQPFTSFGGDRELPELCANGSGVCIYYPTNPDVPIHCETGTSMAAAAVSGITALIQKVNVSLVNTSEACKAILLAGAKRLTNSPRWYDAIEAGIDAKGGSGAVNAENSYRIAFFHIEPEYSSYTEKGWDWKSLGELFPEDFIISPGNPESALSSFYYKIYVPYAGPLIPVKISLSWNKAISLLEPGTTSFSNVDLIDLDLEVYDADDGGLVSHSSSIENNYEIIEFLSPQNKQYNVHIRLTAPLIGEGINDISDEAIEDTYFGIAWNVEVLGESA